MRRMMFILAFLAVGVMAAAQETDTLSTGQKKSERNMLLNAESASAPREINIGLPESGGGAKVYVDGMAHGISLPRSQYHWAGSHMFVPKGSIGLMEAVVTAGEISILLDSRTRVGGDKFSGAFTVGSSTNGLVRFDGAVDGPVKNAPGWYFAIGAYVNNDPTNVNAPNRVFVDQKQMYNLTLSRRWKNSTLDATYRFSICNDNIDNGYSFAPFVYNGDGTISAFGGFRLGRDCYFTADDAVSYMEIRDGKIRHSSLGNMDHRYLHDFSVMFAHKHRSGWDLDAKLHVLYMQPSQSAKIGLAGIDEVTDDKGFTNADGSAFAGYMQNRLVTVDNQEELDVDLRFSAQRRFNAAHKLRLGAELLYSDQMHSASTFYYAHTVEADPSRIYKNGLSTWGMNTSGLYYDSFRFSLPLYALHDYTPVERLLMRTGVRLCPLYERMNHAPRFGDEELNRRVDGFNLADGTLAKMRQTDLPAFDFAVSEHISLRLVDRLFFIAEGFCSMTAMNGAYYKSERIPTGDSMGNAFGRGGLMYDNKWMNVTALASYITSWNNARVMTVTKQIGGVSETIPWTAQYGIGTLGFTLDGNLHFGGFNLHLLGTWQDPRYKNYTNEFVFSDGSKEVIDYTGKHVTGISQLMLEIDPSYSWKNVRVWASARYYSRQYVSRTNLAYFAGHWETFAGVDWNIIEPLKLSVNFVNVLFQNGAKGSIDVADTITDASLLNDYVMSGSYIRPFTVDFMLTYKF